MLHWHFTKIWQLDLTAWFIDLFPIRNSRIVSSYGVLSIRRCHPTSYANDVWMIGMSSDSLLYCSFHNAFLPVEHSWHFRSIKQHKSIQFTLRIESNKNNDLSWVFCMGSWYYQLTDKNHGVSNSMQQTIISFYFWFCFFFFCSKWIEESMWEKNWENWKPKTKNQREKKTIFEI